MTEVETGSVASTGQRNAKDCQQQQKLGRGKERLPSIVFKGTWLCPYLDLTSNLYNCETVNLFKSAN